MKFKELESKPNFSQIQPEVLKFWEENHIFEKSLKDKKGETVFYDGPPVPTGKPHHGTVLVSFIKDMIARYWTMRGTSVPRVWGWDCHGLPIENLAEKTLGIEDKSVIEKSTSHQAADECTCHHEDGCECHHNHLWLKAIDKAEEEAARAEWSRRMP